MKIDDLLKTKELFEIQPIVKQTIRDCAEEVLKGFSSILNVGSKEYPDMLQRPSLHIEPMGVRYYEHNTKADIVIAITHREPNITSKAHYNPNEEGIGQCVILPPLFKSRFKFLVKKKLMSEHGLHCTISDDPVTSCTMWLRFRLPSAKPSANSSAYDFDEPY